MFDAYLIETENEVAGILVRADQGFRFHAILPSYNELERQRFASPWKAERAATLLARSRRRQTGRGADRHSPSEPGDRGAKVPRVLWA
ncbi:MAG: hypothetical protein ACM3Q0_03800 [Bacteroidota bacterium]|jgi:hypothetical protein